MAEQVLEALVIDQRFKGPHKVGCFNGLSRVSPEFAYRFCSKVSFGFGVFLGNVRFRVIHPSLRCFVARPRDLWIAAPCLSIERGSEGLKQKA